MRRKLASISALFLVALGASAQEPAVKEQADAAFERGLALLKGDKVPEACSQFEESYRLLPRGGTLLNLGLCHERQGLLVEAWRELRDARDIARRDGKADREKAAADRIAALEARFAWVTIALAPELSLGDLRVTLDDRPVDVSSRGAMVPVLPGRHTLRAEAPRRKALSRPLSLDAPGQKTTVTIPDLEPDEVAPLPTASASAPPPPSASAPPPPPPPPTSASAPPPPPRAGWSPARTTSLILGAAGLAVSLGAGAWALERKGVVREQCPDKRCTSDEALDAASQGRTLVTVGSIAFAVGAAGLSTFVVLSLIDRPSTQVGLVPAPGGLAARGSF